MFTKLKKSFYTIVITLSMLMVSNEGADNQSISRQLAASKDFVNTSMVEKILNGADCIEVSITLQSYQDGNIQEHKEFRVSKNNNKKHNTGLAFSNRLIPKELFKDGIKIHMNFNIAVYKSGLLNFHFMASNNEKMDKKFKLAFQLFKQNDDEKVFLKAFETEDFFIGKHTQKKEFMSKKHLSEEIADLVQNFTVSFGNISNEGGCMIM